MATAPESEAALIRQQIEESLGISQDTVTEYITPPNPKSRKQSLKKYVSIPDTSVAEYIPAEVFLENMGFFSPSSNKIKGIYSKQKVVGEKTAPDGRKVAIKTKISANHELGLPITSDLDYYRAFLKMFYEMMDQDERPHLPMAAPTRRILSYAGKSYSKKNRDEVRVWLKRMVGTLIEGGIYRAKTKDFKEGFITAVFRQVVVKGEELRNGTIAETNYIWPAPWFISNYLRGYVRKIDLDFHRGLRKPISKSLYPLLETGWYASDGKPYSKSYSDLCNEFLLKKHRKLSYCKQQFDPAHKELQDAEFLDKWQYHTAESKDDLVITYWPGEKYFRDKELASAQRQLASRISNGDRVPKKAVSSELLEDILEICGDRENEAAYLHTLSTYPENLIRRVLADTRTAALEHRILKNRGAYFFNTLKRFADE